MYLPPCPARRSFPGESELFFCAHPQYHCRDNAVTPEACWACQLWKQPAPATFRAPPQVWPPRAPAGCRHLGEQTGLRVCPSCRGGVRVKVFACGHPAHLETTLRECAICPDWEAPPAEAASAGREAPAREV